ncbi:uncharacterized protein BJ171DRAFT_589746 [Polychytrium aggregatum]|uniref:uncharacterized protein n=1 Tax=Polychytrium aggregatum TaxID=110093 RepID=UPI0022FF00FD|nr:uncharacterized protein BJ171DRAFT_589746 [Polychytrium aggregatum]KAI9193021.1 hypothetical protein BJ171DRAFT_589746 [Polychytrium aggregatum]
MNFEQATLTSVPGGPGDRSSTRLKVPLSYAVAVVAIFIVFRVYWRAGSAEIFCLLLSTLVIYVWRQQDQRGLADKNRQALSMYRSLGLPDSLHRDVRLIYLLHCARDLRVLNPPAFDSAVSALSAAWQLEAELMGDTAVSSARRAQLDIYTDLTQEAVRQIASIRYSMDTVQKQDRLDTIIDALKGILDSHAIDLRAHLNVAPAPAPSAAPAP